nr:inactive protein RESTRICTED TEV MOVEMENT 1-like [Ipomoea batatas]
MPEGSGAKWDDHSLGQVEGIIVYQGSSSVHSLGFFCVKDNINQRSEQHGQCVGKCEMIILDYPTELLIGVHGFYYRSQYNAVVIRCITFGLTRPRMDPLVDNVLTLTMHLVSSYRGKKKPVGLQDFMDNIHQISEQHGCSGGNSEMIALDYPTEFLTAVHGYRDGSANLYSSSSSITIKSITFVTNKTTYGPFGQQLKGNCGTPFGFKFSGKESRNWISGFYGTVYQGSLECLGVYVQTPTTSQPDESIRQCKSEIQC